MTGLDVNKEVIIECAAIVTDLDFNTLETYETVVKQDQKYLDAMDDWNTRHHGASGLTEKVPHGKVDAEVEKDLLMLIGRHWSNEADRPILAGNSIGQDRLFISKYWKNLDQKLHYRMLDVSAYKIIFNQKYNLKYSKQEKHRALLDISESIEELKFYLSHFKGPSVSHT